MKLNPEEANFISIFVRKLKTGKTYEDFKKNWFPDKPFPIPVRVINSININDKSEILSVGFLKINEDEFDDVLNKISVQESVRHERISDVIEKTELKAIYRIVDDYNLDDLTKNI
ncbi:MAG TPA: hypothetical protein PLG90_00005 [Ignavibacteria bacterium]|nr:hypothetical protein [Ignavibacteria bacterium]